MRKLAYSGRDGQCAIIYAGLVHAEHLLSDPMPRRTKWSGMCMPRTDTSIHRLRQIAAGSAGMFRTPGAEKTIR